MTAQYILVVDDEPDIRQLLSEILEDEGYEVEVAENAAKARELHRLRKPDLVLLDIWMPGEDGVSLLKSWHSKGGLCCPVIMMSGHATIETAVEATKYGAYDFIEKPLSLAKTLLTISHALRASQLEQENQGLRQQVTVLKEPIGSSAVMVQLKEQARKIAAHDLQVLLYGEPGSGKEGVAHYIHQQSSRGERPFVKAVVSAFSQDDISKELFGWEENGKTHYGLLDQARSGTLYLSAISYLTEEAQKYLLFALKERRYRRVGGEEWISLDASLIVSCGHDLKDQVEAGMYSAELYYLLNEVPLSVPSLREHSEDVPDLLNYYVDLMTVQESLPYRHFSLAAQNYLRTYPWPGNIRELRNLVQRLLILGSDVDISQDEVEEAIGTQIPVFNDGVGQAPENLFDLPLRQAREQFEHDYLVYQLQQTRGNVSKLAEKVQMERTHLYRKMRALEIDPKQYGR
jgi:two-component system nitrogen regulation response regulator NtrX